MIKLNLPVLFAQKGIRVADADRLTDYFDTVIQRLEFYYWLFGHYHENRNIGQNYVLLYEQIVQVL